jgi:hypothetical protein
VLRAELVRRGTTLEPEVLRLLASRFRLSSGQIKSAAAAGLIRSQWTQAAGTSTSQPEGPGNSAMADDIVTPTPTLDDL